MPTVDLVYAPDCPHVSLARARLLEAFAQMRVAPHWSEHRIGDPGAEAHVRGYGSPTILVDGRDVAELEPGSEACCRLYGDRYGTSGAPSVEQIVAAFSSGG